MLALKAGTVYLVYLTVKDWLNGATGMKTSIAESGTMPTMRVRYLVFLAEVCF